VQAGGGKIGDTGEHIGELLADRRMLACAERPCFGIDVVETAA